MKRELIRRFIYYRPVRTLLHFLRKTILPGFQGVPLFDVAKFFTMGLYKSSLTQRAAATAFHFILALFPLLLFCFTILPYIPITKLYMHLYELLQEILPETTYDSVKNTLDDIIVRKHNGLMSIGFIMSAYVASNGINAILISFNQSKQIHANQERKWLKRRILSIVLIFLIGIAMIVAFALIVGFKALSKHLIGEGYINYGMQLFLLKTAKWVLLIVFTYFAFATIYYLAPREKRGYKYFSVGATMATLLLILTTQGFNYYITHFSRYNVLYGSIGALIILMIWIYINCFILLIGFELNASLAEASNSIYSQRTNKSSRVLRKRTGIF